MDFDFGFGSFLYFIDWFGFGSSAESVSTTTIGGNKVSTTTIGG